MIKRTIFLGCTGLTEQIQKEREMVAKDGKLSVIVQDFYGGKVAADHEEAGHLMSGLGWPGALQDIAGAAKFLKSYSVADPGFPVGGVPSHWGVPTSNAGTFW